MRQVRLGRERVWAAAGLGLVALAIWPWVAPLGAPDPAAGAGATSAPGAAPVIPDLPPLANFPTVFQRPLFTPSRRPSTEEQSPVADRNLAARYRLLGLLSIGETRRALIAEGDRRVEIAEGATLDGWKVLRIEQDRVLLASPNGRTELKLQRSAPETKPGGPQPQAR